MKRFRVLRDMGSFTKCVLECVARGEAEVTVPSKGLI